MLRSSRLARSLCPDTVGWVANPKSTPYHSTAPGRLPTGSESSGEISPALEKQGCALLHTGGGAPERWDTASPSNTARRVSIVEGSIRLIGI
jgi:hypothetical protein